MKVTKVACPQCNADSSDDQIYFHSGITMVDGSFKPFIHVSWGHSSELRAQLSPEQLRQHALDLLEAAEAAESDAAVGDLCRQEIKLDMHATFRIIAGLRQRREQRMLKQTGRKNDG